MASVSITINDKKVTAEPGQTILEAATSAGVDIPTLCHHPALKPIGACRLCLVEISGQRVLQPACTFPVTAGMTVNTESPKVVRARKFLLQLIFTERNHFCMYCELSGDCELQALAYRYGLDHMTYPTYLKPFPVDATAPYFVLDHNRCVLCRRCLRACSELVANHTLEMRQRGAATMVNADANLSIGASSCLSCGTCLDVCPTGALIDKRSAFMGREIETKQTKSICSQCSIGCGLKIVTREGSVLRIEGDWAAPVNRGVLCQQGRFHPLGDKRERILKPLLRKNGRLLEGDWNKALEKVARRLETTAAEKLGVLISTHATNEALHLVKDIFCTELKARQVGLLNRVAPIFHKKSAGSLADIPLSDCILVAGADPVRDYPVASFLVKRAVDNGAQLIVLEDDGNGLAPFAHLILDTEELPRAAEIVERARRPVVICGAAVTEQASRILQELESRALFVTLQPGVNTLAAARLELEVESHTAALETLFVLIGDQEWQGRLLPARMGKETFVVAQACYRSALTDLADVVLPMSIWSEQSGSLTNTHGFVQELHKATEPIGEAKADWEILSLLAEALENKSWTYSLGEDAVIAAR